MVKYSVVIPLKDEEENILPLIDELHPIMEQMREPWELICVDDGSKDGTLPLLMKFSQNNPYLRVLIFDANYGQSSAFDAGFRAAKGEFIITLDGDRQNDPADIPKMVRLAASADLVCGIRAKRKDTWVKKITSTLANAIRGRFLNDGVKDTGCSLKVYRRSCFSKIKLYHGMHRFLPALFLMEGFKIEQVPVNHRERTKGKTKYNFLNRSLNTVFDMFAVRWMRKRRLHYIIQKEVP